MQKPDVKDLVAWLHTDYEKPNTRHTYKSVIKLFWRWIDGGEEYPETVAWMKLKNPGGNEALLKDLLTKDDSDAHIDATNNERDAAFIWMLYVMEARTSELIDLTVGNIGDRKHGRKVVINCKTGRAGCAG